MQFDFNEQYKHYSDTELLHITQQPDAYQPEALAAASRILKERGVSPEKARTLILQEDSTHLLDSFDMTEQPKLPQLLVLFLGMAALEYLWRFYGVLKVFPFEHAISILSYSLITLLELAYLPFVFFLLWKRKSWGWILIFVSTALGGAAKILQFDYILEYVGLDNQQGLIFIGITCLKLAFTYYLWRKEIVGFFQVTKREKFWTTVVAICLSVVILLNKVSAF